MGRARPAANAATKMDVAPVPEAAAPDVTSEGRPHLQWMVNRWRPEGREKRAAHLARPYDSCTMVFPNSIGTYQAALATQERRQSAMGIVQRLGAKLG